MVRSISPDTFFPTRYLAKGSEYMYLSPYHNAPGPTVPLSSGMIFD